MSGNEQMLQVRRLQAKLADAEAERDALRAQVGRFIAARVEFVTTLRQCVDTNEDYYRWQGHAEARRHLAVALGIKVPYEQADVEEVYAALSSATATEGGT